MIVGLDRPTSGRVLVGGRRYVDRVAPLPEVGALLEGRSAQPGRRAVDHLRWLAYSNRIPQGRTREVLELCGIGAAARRRAGKLSLGMSQRLGLAAALLGDPPVLILDEPTNGLDPEGISWLRRFLQGLGAGGRTILISSHLIAEIAEITDHVLVVGRGRLLADCATADLPAMAGLRPAVRVRVDQAAQLARRLAAQGAAVESPVAGTLLVTGPGREAIAATASAAGLVVTELTEVTPSLEEAYLALTGPAAEQAGRPARHPEKVPAP